jgi:HD-like signal output (HDOD) protein
MFFCDWSPCVSALYLWIAFGFLAAVGWWALRRSRKSPLLSASPAHAAPQQTSRVASTAEVAALATPIQNAPAAAEPLPPTLAALQWRREGDLTASEHEALMIVLRAIPRPSASLQELLSPEVAAKASSTELNELVMGETLVAAKVLGGLNAPFYGLQRPVTGVGQAVTFLGMNTVRSICLQHMLADAFKPESAAAQQVFDTVWRASAIASELGVRLGKALNLPDQGGLATQVVLGFVGHLATASLLPPGALASWLPQNRVDRVEQEQAALPLSAGELGGLLLQAWDLPAALIAGAGDISRLLVTPRSAIENERVPRLALGFLCSRLGEQLALGQRASLLDYDAAQDIGPDTHHLRSCLAHPALAGLSAALRSPDMQAAVHRMLQQAPSAG